MVLCEMVLCEMVLCEMVLCEMVLCEMVLCEMVLCEMVLCEMITGNCKIYSKRKVCKQIQGLLNKSVPESLRICKLVTNYKATQNGFAFVSHGRREVFTPRLGNIRFPVTITRTNHKTLITNQEFSLFHDLACWRLLTFTIEVI